MIRREWFRFKKMRILAAWIGAPFLFFFSHISAASFFWGGLLTVIGELVRLWALSFMERKGTRLAVGGPFAFCRNPLYVGNFFLGLGVVVICANWIIVLLFLVGYSVMYLGTIRQEEKELQERFGKVYEDSYQNVPRLFPRLTPYAAPDQTAFDWKRIVRHHEYVTVLGVALLLCGIHLYDTLWLQKESLASQTGSIVAALVLLAVLIFERLFISNFKQMFAEGLPNLFLKK